MRPSGGGLLTGDQARKSAVGSRLALVGCDGPMLFRFVRHLPACHTHDTMRQDEGQVWNRPRRGKSRRMRWCRVCQERPLIVHGIESIRRQTTVAVARPQTLDIDVVKDAPGPMFLFDGPRCAEQSRRPFRRFAIVFVDPVFRPINLTLNDLNSLRIVAELVL